MSSTIAGETPLAATDRLFFGGAHSRLDRDAAERVLAQSLAGADDGELYLEYRESEAISLDDSVIRSAGFNTSLGFGLRAVAGEAAGYGHAGELSEDAVRRAAATVSAVAAGHSGTSAEPPRASNARLYSDANPLAAMEFAKRTGLLADIDVYARGKDERVRQVMASIAGEWQAVQILRPDGVRVADIRPLVRALDQELGGNSEFYNLPRKFKISVTACPDWCSYPEINDIALVGAVRPRRANN